MDGTCEFDPSVICCCGISLQRGVKEVANYFMTVSMICIVCAIVDLSWGQWSMNSMPTDPEAYNVGVAIYAVYFTFMALLFLMGLLLVYGAEQADCCKLRVWGVYTIIVTVLDILGLVACIAYCTAWNTFGSTGGIAILLFFWVLVQSYSLVLVKSFVKHIRDHPDEYILAPKNPVQSEDIENIDPGNVQPEHSPSDCNAQPQVKADNMHPEPINMQPQAGDMQPQST